MCWTEATAISHIQWSGSDLVKCQEEQLTPSAAGGNLISTATYYLAHSFTSIPRYIHEVFRSQKPRILAEDTRYKMAGGSGSGNETTMHHEFLSNNSISKFFLPPRNWLKVKITIRITIRTTFSTVSSILQWGLDGFDGEILFFCGNTWQLRNENKMATTLHYEFLPNISMSKFFLSPRKWLKVKNNY